MLTLNINKNNVHGDVSGWFFDKAKVSKRKIEVQNYNVYNI